ncbi:MAG: hypothetical protein WCL14_03160 [Bacteroidota bacterium]
MALSSRSSLLPLLVFLWLFSACTHSEKPEDKSKDEASCTKSKSMNPNGDSELALLMRQMYDSLLAMNLIIKNGGIPATFPDAFLKIHTAKPTDSHTKPDGFDAYADDYLNTYKKIYQSPKSELKSAYNLTVQKCATCHEASCPGPLKKINKLKLEL